MINEEMLVRVTGPVVRELLAVLLGDRYLERHDLPPEIAALPPPGHRPTRPTRREAPRRCSQADPATARARPRR